LNTKVITNNISKKKLEKIFKTFETWRFQQLKDLSFTNLKLSMNRKNLSHTFSQTSKLKFFPNTFTLKNLQHFEEISYIPPTHLERLLLSLQSCKLKKASLKRILPFYAKPLTTSCFNTMSFLLLGVGP
jgi:hypothetical protein